MLLNAEWVHDHVDRMCRCSCCKFAITDHRCQQDQPALVQAALHGWLGRGCGWPGESTNVENDLIDLRGPARRWCGARLASIENLK